MAIDYKPDQNDYKNLTPFKDWLLNQINTWGFNNFPFLENDFDQLTNYGMLMKMMKCLTDIIANENLVEDDMNKLYQAFTELQNYINNYFDNLDVQDEINNKLDELVESGELKTIIGEFLTSLTKIVFVGDSYSVGWTPDGDVKSWTEFCKDYLGLSSSQYLLLGSGGASFGSNVNNFTMLVNAATADPDVTDVVCCGGYNEIGQTTANTLSGMQSFKSACATKYPNAKVHVGFIANTTDKTQKANIAGRCGTYVNGCSLYGMHYLNNVEYSLHRYYEDFSSDGIHPNATGNQHIGMYVTQALRTGSADVIINNTYMVPYESGGGLWHFQTNVRNSVTTIMNIANTSFTYTSETLPAFALNGNNAVDLFTVEDGNIIGSGIFTSRGITPNVLITYEDNTYCVMNTCQFEIVDNKFKLYPCVLNASATNFLTKQIKAISIKPFAYVFSTLDV